MIREVNVEILRVALISAVAMLLGFLLGFPFHALFVGLSLYTLWIFWQIILLARWVAAAKKVDPPVSSGIFEFLFERLFRLERDHQRSITKLKMELARQLSLIADVRDGVALVNKDGQIEWFNHQASSLLGVTSPRDIGAPLINFLRAPEFVAYFNKREFAEPLRALSPKNSAQWLEFSVTVYDRGESLILIRDVTQMQRLEIARRDFVANLSHELRTPLTVLQGYLETLQAAENTPPVERALSEMERQSRRMLGMLSDLSRLSKLESVEPPEHRDWHLLAAPIRQICSEVTALNNDVTPQFEFDLDETLAVRGDLPEIYSAFTNLVTNAIKYGGKGGEIKIRWVAEPDGARFSVSDNGPGIDARHIPRLTERFYRADSNRNSETGGTGLGLAIVKHVLLRHDADLMIQSRPGSGSAFSCRFYADRIRHQENDPPQDSLTGSSVAV